MANLPPDVRDVLWAVSTGQLSVKHAMRVLANMAARSSDPTLEELAKLARTAGPNLERGLLRWVNRQRFRQVLPMVVRFPLPAWRKGKPPFTLWHGLMLPHLVRRPQLLHVRGLMLCSAVGGDRTWHRNLAR